LPGLFIIGGVTRVPGEGGTEIARIAAAYRERDSRLTGGYRFANPAYALYMQFLERALLETFRLGPLGIEGARLLDVGCGGGYFVHRFLEFGADSAAGVDLLPERIEAAEQRYPRAQFYCANAAEMPFEDGEFDVVTQFVCFSSILDPTLREQISAEMWRVLHPGGIVLSYDMRPEPWPIRARRGVRARRGSAGADGPHTPTITISAAELQRLFPDGELRYKSVGLDFELCAAFCRRSVAAAHLLAALPSLRTHAIATIRKPAGDMAEPGASGAR
jgi:SAM-dependent methyltransferase